MGLVVRLMIASVLATPLFGQTRSERRIPVTKGRPAPPHADTVRLIVHDTVVIQRTDTLSIFQTATLPPTTPSVHVDSVEKSCSNRYIPIPIPIPLPRGHGSGGGEAPGGGSAPATTATPEPATWLLVGSGLAATAFMRARKRARAKEPSVLTDDAGQSD